MKAYKLFFKPDRAVPQFRRLRSHAAEAVVNRLNEDDARVAALKDFGYSHDLHTASGPSRYSYGGFVMGATQYREPTLADQLRALGKEVYFVRDLAFRELFKIAWERLKAGWTTAVARSMLLKRFYEFNELRRFLKSKDASVKLQKRDEVETLDLGAEHRAQGRTARVASPVSRPSPVGPRRRRSRRPTRWAVQLLSCTLLDLCQSRLWRS